jgi:hypothetical protein
MLETGANVRLRAQTALHVLAYRPLASFLTNCFNLSDN